MNPGVTDPVSVLAGPDHKKAWGLTQEIIEDCRHSGEWMEYFDVFASFLSHPKSLIRNRGLMILASLVPWDAENRFDSVLEADLSKYRESVRPLIEKDVAETRKQLKSIAARE